MECPYLQNGECLVASALAGATARTSEKACAECLKAYPPRSANHVTASLAISAHRGNKERQRETHLRVRRYIPLTAPAPQPPPQTTDEDKAIALTGGPGTELHARLRSMGFRPRKGCSCKKHAAEMDRNGAQWCRENLEQIVDWMEEEASHRIAGWVFTRAAARQLVLWSIKRAESKGHGSGQSGAAGA